MNMQSVSGRALRLASVAILGVTAQAALAATATDVTYVKAKAQTSAYFGSQTDVVNAIKDAGLPGGIGSGTAEATSGIADAGAYASANLGNGKIRMRAVGSEYSASSGSAEASFGDVLQFTIAGAAPTDVTLIGVRLSFDGTLKSLAPYAGGNASVGYAFTMTDNNGYTASTNFYAAKIAQNSATMSVASYGNWTNIPAHTNVTFAGTEGFAPMTITPEWSYNFLFPLIGANPFVRFDMRGSAGALFGWDVDFRNTGSIGLQLPTGVSFTSQSGTFLTATGVPEPQSWALLILGFGTVGMVARRRRSLVVAA